MSAALAERVGEVPVAEAAKKPSLVQAEAAAVSDPHPLVPVFVIGAISLAGALAFVGVIIAWLALRPSGINAPF